MKVQTNIKAGQNNNIIIQAANQAAVVGGYGNVVIQQSIQIGANQNQ